MLFAVFSFSKRFFSSSTVVSVAKVNVLQTPTIAVFAQNWSGADPNFAPFRWRIWLTLSEFLCFLANQNVMFVTLSCTKLPFFCTVLPKKCIPLSQSQSRNFFMYIISTRKAGLLWGLRMKKSTPHVRLHRRVTFDRRVEVPYPSCFLKKESRLQIG